MSQQEPNNDQGEKPLAPIPSDGTSAPSDSGRVFGQSKGAGSQQPDQSDRSEQSGQGDQGGQSEQPGQPGQSGQSGQLPERSPRRGGGPARQSREPLSEDEQRKLRIRGRVAIIVAFTGLFVAVLFLPSGILFGLPLGLAGGVLGVGAYVRGRRAAVSVPGSVPAIVIGAVALLMTLVIAAVSIAFRGELQRAADCLDGANTRIAQQQCMRQLEQDMSQRGVDLNLSDVSSFGGL